MKNYSLFKLALICGGPSLERGISLNSARSVMDHLASSAVEIIPLYVDFNKNFFQISPSQLYSNTPADFDFKLHSTSRPLDLQSLQTLLETVDLVFPVIHGSFGEDGELQTLLEEWKIPFVGSSSHACREMFCKVAAAEKLKTHGFYTEPREVFDVSEPIDIKRVECFFETFQLKQAIVKPAIGGSSIGVHLVSDSQSAILVIKDLLNDKGHQKVILEPFCQGTEFTVVVLQNAQGDPVALIPTQIELKDSVNQLLDFRKKYLPTNQAAYHTPPLFASSIAERIQVESESLFRLFQMRDFVRIDGWVFPDGSLYFSDINPLSGLEQNSFFFRQAAVLGMSHQQALKYVLKRACQRYSIDFPEPSSSSSLNQKKPVFVMFGSNTAERQVSLMSGTNVWLKLLHSQINQPIPIFYDGNGEVWKIPYAHALNHTVEEIYSNCLSKPMNEWVSRIQIIQERLEFEKSETPQMIPQNFSLESFFEEAKRSNAFVFIAMHGGEGENGVLQSSLERYQIPYNGSNPKVSALCMDKYLTGQIIHFMNDPDISSTPKELIGTDALSRLTENDCLDLWKKWCLNLSSSRLIIKPRSDGCSAGIILLTSFDDLYRYSCFCREKVAIIPAGMFIKQDNPVEMPQTKQDFLVEPYIQTDRILIQNHRLSHESKDGWIELTIGVLEKEGKYHALNPSITIAEGAVLSLEEKFQGGTGINLTPPPEELLSKEATNKIKKLAERVAKVLGINNYARLDLFFNWQTEKMILIEANTLPALTPSTVFYHQGLAEEIPLSPLVLLENIIGAKWGG